MTTPAARSASPLHDDAGAAGAAFRFDNSYVRELAGTWSACRPVPVAAPRVLHVDHALADELGLDGAALDTPAGAALLSGNALPAGAEPIAQAYAGHQFGGFSPQLGDGRALLVGEVVDRLGVRRDIAFKGSGRTPFSRGGDGRAAVGPMLREAVVSTAMHALGIPTTRALAVVATGEAVWRDTALPGAVLTRVASSHLRVGTFQYFAARDDRALLERLVAYALRRHPGDATTDDGTAPPALALALLRGTARRQARLVAHWMNVGFIHGVMNTDNMTVSGETIDYGPCAFLEAYDPAAVFSSIDRQGRYAFGNQPAVARWNLSRLAEALLPLLHDDEAAALEAAHAVLDAFPADYRDALREGQRAKLGLAAALDGGQPDDRAAERDRDRDRDDDALADDWLALLRRAGADFTLAHAELTATAEGGDAAANGALRRRLQGAGDGAVDDWLRRWQERRAQDGVAAGPAVLAAMRRANPLLIARNHRVEEVLEAASARDDLVPLRRLLALLRTPWAASADDAAWLAPAAPEVTAAYRTFCGT